MAWRRVREVPIRGQWCRMWKGRAAGRRRPGCRRGRPRGIRPVPRGRGRVRPTHRVDHRSGRCLHRDRHRPRPRPRARHGRGPWAGPSRQLRLLWRVPPGRTRDGHRTEASSNAAPGQPLAARPENRATLLVLKDHPKVRALYESWGWQTLGDLRPRIPHAPLFHSMLLDLPPDHGPVVDTVPTVKP